MSTFRPYVGSSLTCTTPRAIGEGRRQSDKLDIPAPSLNLGPAMAMAGRDYRSIKSEAEEADEMSPLLFYATLIGAGTIAIAGWVTILVLILFEWS